MPISSDIKRLLDSSLREARVIGNARRKRKNIARERRTLTEDRASTLARDTLNANIASSKSKLEIARQDNRLTGIRNANTFTTNTRKNDINAVGQKDLARFRSGTLEGNKVDRILRSSLNANRIAVANESNRLTGVRDANTFTTRSGANAINASLAQSRNTADSARLGLQSSKIDILRQNANTKQFNANTKQFNAETKRKRSKLANSQNAGTNFSQDQMNALMKLFKK